MSEQTETVEVPVEAASVAHRELEILIEETAPVGENGYPMTPLARVRQRLAEEFDDDAAAKAVSIVGEVANQTGAESAAVDPLQDDIFRAHSALSAAVEEGENQ